MCIAHAWRNGGEAAWSSLTASGLELITISLCVASMYWMQSIASFSALSVFPAAVGLWLAQCGSMFAFGLLIYVVAHGRGNISRILAYPALVVLGEISFSLYLIHQILLTYYRTNISQFPKAPNALALSVFLGVLLLSSYLMWTFVEMPGRRLIIGRGKIHGTPIMRKSWRDHPALNRKSLFAGLALGSIIVLISFASRAPRLGKMSLAQISEQRVGTSASCNIESIDSMVFKTGRLAVARKIQPVTGWFLPEHSRRTGIPAVLRFVNMDGSGGWEVALEKWHARPDVLAVKHGMDGGNVGFSQTIDLSPLPPGRYKLVVVYADSGISSVCDKDRELDVQ